MYTEFDLRNYDRKNRATAEIKFGYEHVYTPILANVDLYKTSGHWDHYQDSMFPPMDLGNGELLVLYRSTFARIGV